MVALYKPLCKEHMIMNVIYTVISSVIFILLYIGLYKDKRVCIFASYILVSFRNGLRLLDLENTREYKGNGFLM